MPPEALYPQPTLLLGACAALLVLFSAVATTDGLYYHLYRYRLYLRPRSRKEHRLHTANVTVFPLMTYLLFCAQPAGLHLWLAAALFALTFVVETVDVFSEYDSRADLGGLTRTEYFMHFLMSGLRWGTVMPLLFTAPAGAWHPGATALGGRPLWFLLAGWCMVVPGVCVAALHLVLDYVGRSQLAAAAPEDVIGEEAPRPATALDG